MKYILILAFSFLFSFQLSAQNKTEKKPKLVVGIVVDQMRYDYLTRFWERYGDDGFKRLIKNGYNFKNHHFNYVPTYTGPGHASVWTGTSPMNHGIIGNSWFNKFEDRFVYCAGDESVKSVGTSDDAGKMSPHRMKTTSVADQNRLFTQMKGKTIGVALKDRGSILPAGHTANAAYWFHGRNEGKWITSSFYMEELPQWVKEFNASDKAESYFKTWNTLYDIETYVESGDDINDFEGGFKGKSTASFPYDLDKLKKENGNYEIIKISPFGSDLTTDFAKAAIEGEELGQDEYTDFLTLSYSSTDYLGHNFGVNSKEVQDAYLRLDHNIADILEYLDEKVGQGNYTIFLTADHGAVDVPAYLQSVKIPGGYFNDVDFTEKLQDFVAEEFDEEGLIMNVSNGQVFFNYQILEEAGIEAENLEKTIAAYILKQEQMDKVITRSQLTSGSYTTGIRSLLQNGFNQRRSGDVIFVLNPATITYSRTGSTHGSGLTYDTHAPLIFYGAGVKQGSTTQRSEIPDIAPTVSALLGIAFPNGATGKPLFMMLDE
ncbi:alkaline phosphatase PafA [Salegentibacter sediminis]|uniref:alkaline phosphatase PafA n=1 Tax=Salegentibacter sediminis TaxID=1930251 RepID=UPI0009BDA4E5|nr:alkaline phosphatase PafA [Salegentibacter sediminis]